MAATDAPEGGPSAAERAAFLADWPPLDLTASSADYYFNSYNHYGVHEDVLKDTVTTAAYQKVIKQNAHLFRGAVVLDVCPGLGLLSLLAAEAGARKVIALEPQAELVAMGQKLARQNGFGEVIEFVNSTVSALDSLPGDLTQVDIIISEWMGYFLLYEARLGEVLRARERWLKPGGLLFPDRAKLYVALLEDAAYKERHFDYYNSVWGFDFSAAKEAAHGEPVVNLFEQTQVISTASCVLDANLYFCSEDSCFQAASSYQVQAKSEGRINGLLFWFEIRFDSCHKPISFTTGPDVAPTCWKQTAFFLSGIPPAVKQGDRVSGKVAWRKFVADKRHLDVKLSCRVRNGKPRIEYYRWT